MTPLILQQLKDNNLTLEESIRELEYLANIMFGQVPLTTEEKKEEAANCLRDDYVIAVKHNTRLLERLSSVRIRLSAINDEQASRSGR